MRKILFSLIICVLSLRALADSPDFIVAKVNNKAITRSELDDRYKFVLSITNINVKTSQDKKMLREQLLDKMVDEELIRQDATVQKIDVAPGEMRDALDEIAMQQKKNATQLKLSIINKGMSFDNYLAQIESEILWSKIISNALRSKVKVTDAEVSEFFEQQKFDTDIKRFHIAEIFIPNSENAKELAEKLVGELRQEDNFKNIVRQFSRSLSVDADGDLGWVSHNDIDPKIYDAISRVPKGGYSNVVALNDGFFIFKIIDRKTENKIADKDLNAAKNIIFSRKLQNVAKGYLMDLRKRAFVERKAEGI